MIFARLRRPVIRNCFGWTVYAARTTIVAECCDTGIDGVIYLQRHVGDHAAKTKQGPHLRMNDGAMSAQLTEASFQSKGNMKHIAVTNGMLDGTRIAEAANVISELNDNFAQ